MRLTQNDDIIMFGKGEYVYSFLSTGDIFEFTCGNFLINEFQGSAMEGSANNIYLRIYKEGAIKFYPLLGISSKSRLSRGQNTLVYSGEVEGIAYTVTFYPADDGIWFWNVELCGSGVTVDVVYGQDIGVASKGGVLTNELYMAQYLGHRVFETENGYCVCSRQNQPQDGCFPYIQQGMIKGRAVGYSTDGMQFFGLSYKETQKPEALTGDLPNKNYQYEFSYIGLQSEKTVLEGKHSLTFYAIFRKNHEDAIRELEYTHEVMAAFDVFSKLMEEVEDCPQIKVRDEFGEPFASREWSVDEIDALFPERKLEEQEDGQLLSFFTPKHSHVVLKQKELMVERPHGTIITTMINPDRVDNRLISSTNYIYGLFNAQMVVGNTSFHKFLSAARGMLNVLKNSGQRLYVKIDGKYRLLTLPSVYEMGMNYSRWFYSIGDDILRVTTYAAAERCDIILQVESMSNKAYDFIVTNQVVMGENEFQHPAIVEEVGIDRKTLRFRPDPEHWANNPYPGLHYDVHVSDPSYTLSDDRIFFEDGKSRNGTLVTLSIRQSSGFSVVMHGALEEEEEAATISYNFEDEWEKYYRFYRKISGGLQLKKEGEGSEKIEKLNETIWWFTHNALVHFAVPHGLEQPGGAAWGTRDVCQGPMEFFLTTQNYLLARSTLLTVFSHQTLQTGEWPQWFMFDRYPYNAGECHGDVVFWPLKCIGDYLHESGDYSILEEKIPYIDEENGRATLDSETLLEHIKRAFGSIEKRFLDGTHLISYAGGDWDDTLQPADESMKEKLVSSWTQALAYQVLTRLAETLSTVDEAFSGQLRYTARQIKKAFDDILVKDGVIAGFVCREDDGSFKHMLHPSDDSTSIHYRLLPMTRSIIAGLVDKEQAYRNVEVIDEHLSFPDGVRLMDRPARYDGGISHLFRRAEQAANVGREISLQYTHAHIRYIEAMAKLGESQKAWDALLKVNPVKIKDEVPNALTRQSNMYFSSSEGAFLDRYDYEANFDKLRDGSISVKGGWRLYSSGPGIYIRQLVSNILGIRFEKDSLVIDPVMPCLLDGLQVTLNCFGRETTFIYKIADDRKGTVRVLRNSRELAGKPGCNEYRGGKIVIDKQEFLQENGHVEIYLD